MTDERLTHDDAAAKQSRITRLRHLFSTWPRHQGQGFISDGIVDEAVWDAVSVRVLYLMKEPNSPNNQRDWSLCDDFLAPGAPGYTATWGLTARWTRGITEGPLRWTETEDFDYSKASVRQPLLRRIAVVNVKKTGGAGSTPRGSLRPIVAEDKGFIRDEIAIIEPHIIVCCGTRPEATTVFPELKWDKIAGNGVRWCRCPDQDWAAIDYYHPQARYPHNFLYTMLVDAIRDAGVPASPSTRR
jgi:hypothetical protein